MHEMSRRPDNRAAVHVVDGDAFRLVSEGLELRVGDVFVSDRRGHWVR